MMMKTMFAACVAATLVVGAACAQTAPAPATPAPVTPAAPALGRPAATATTRAAPAAKPAVVPSGTKVNLNTATASELDALPQIGKARAKVIMDERAKSSFKDWADFDKRTEHTSVNAGVKSKIKDLVSF